MKADLKAFCEIWLATFNAAEAYHQTHPKAKRNTCWTEGSATLRNPEVQAYISERLKEQAISADEVLARLANISRGTLEHFIQINKDGFPAFDFSGDDAKGNLYQLKKIKTKRSRRVVGRGEAAEEWEDEYVEVELNDPVRALEDLAKYHKLFTDKDDDSDQLADDERIARIASILDAARARRDGQAPT